MSSFLYALNRKIAQINDDQLNNENHHVQFFNAEFQKANTLFLNNFEINRIGDNADDVSAIKVKCSHIEELHLMQNKLERWEDIRKILCNLSKLQFLNLSQNYFHCHNITDLGCYKNLQALILNETFLDWSSIAKLIHAFPNLKELHLSSNGYRSVLIDVLPEENHQEIVSAEPHTAMNILYFQNNPVKKWCDFCRLGRVFPELESLVIANCPVESLECTSKVCVIDNGNKNRNVCSFKKLNYLNLNDTKLDHWIEIDRLRRFPSLTNLNIQRLPLWAKISMTKDELRQLLLKKLPNIQILNRSYISEEDQMENYKNLFDNK